MESNKKNIVCQCYQGNRSSYFSDNANILEQTEQNAHLQTKASDAPRENF